MRFIIYFIGLIIGFIIGVSGTFIYFGTYVYENPVIQTINVSETAQCEKDFLEEVNSCQSECPKLYCPICQNQTELKYVFRKTNYPSINIINKVAQANNYEKGVFNCVNFTNQVYEGLQAKGYLVDRYTTYWKSKQTYHSFIGLYNYYETTDGTEILPSEYGDYGIPNELRQFNPEEDGVDYYDQDSIDRDYIGVCQQ
jgi:hypothetical protein